MTNSKSYLTFKISLLMSVVLLFASCDKDYNTIGTEIIGQDSYGLNNSEIVINASTQNIGPVQSNNLPINPLGIYTNALSETTTADFVTQLELVNANPTINLDLKPVIDSVILTIPYFSTKTSYKEDGVSGIYRLDSIYGGTEAKLKLSIYESGYFLRDIDPSTQLAQQYYSNQGDAFDSAKKTLLNNGDLKSENEEFAFSKEEIQEKTTNSKGEKTINRKAPEMRINLNKGFFQNKFFTSAASGKLTTNNDFKNYFRGLYFKVEKTGVNNTNMAMLNFKGGKITIYYKQNQSASNTATDDKTIVLNLTGNSVSLLKNSANKPIDTKNLRLKGGEGSMVVLNLFNPEDANGNGISDELESLRASNILINDATLTVNVDKDVTNNDTNLPNRLYLYDIDNNKQLLDYTYDSSVRPYRKFDKYVHGGIIDKSSTSYKIKLTYHLRNLIKNDTVKNVRLGLVITENINEITNKKLKTPITIGTKNITDVPTSSVMSPLEAIIYGNTAEVPSDKKLKLEIYYTKPN